MKKAFSLLLLIFATAFLVEEKHGWERFGENHSDTIPGYIESRMPPINCTTAGLYMIKMNWN